MEDEEVDRTLDATKLLLEALEEDPSLLQDEYFMQKLSYLRDQHSHTTRYLRRARRTLADPKPSTSTDWIEERVTKKYVAPLYERSDSDLHIHCENPYDDSENEENSEILDQKRTKQENGSNIDHSPGNRPSTSKEPRENSRTPQKPVESLMEARKRQKSGQNATTSSLYSKQRLREYGRDLELQGKAKSLHDLRSKTDRPKWTPNVTIPRPFSMSQREPKRNTYSTRFLEDLQKEKQEREKAEQEAIKNTPKFKAKQPPPTTYFPDNSRVFDEKYIETIRKKVTANLRARQMGQGRTRSTGELAGESRRARPVPLSTYVAPPPISEIKREKEAHRRAVELLEEAATPNGIREHEVLTHIRGKMRHHDCREKQEFRLHRSRSVPDFRSIHQRLREQLETAKRAKATTIPSPFRLSASKSRRHKTCSSRSPPRLPSPQPVPSFTDPPIVRPTKTEILRKGAVREQMHRRYQLENGSREFWESRKEALEESRRRLTATLGERPIFDLDSKIEERRRAQIENEREYLKELEEIRNRVLARPLILEQQENLIQKQAMQRKFLQRISDFKKEQIKKQRLENKKDIKIPNDSRNSSNATFLVENEKKEEPIEKDSLNSKSSLNSSQNSSTSSSSTSTSKSSKSSKSKSSSSSTSSKSLSHVSLPE